MELDPVRQTRARACYRRTLQSQPRTTTTARQAKESGVVLKPESASQSSLSVDNCCKSIDRSYSEYVSCDVACIMLCHMYHVMSHVSCHIAHRTYHAIHSIVRTSIMSHRTYHVTSYVSCCVARIISRRT
jgi:hypothetical protein